MLEILYFHINGLCPLNFSSLYLLPLYYVLVRICLLQMASNSLTLPQSKQELISLSKWNIKSNAYYSHGPDAFSKSQNLVPNVSSLSQALVSCLPSQKIFLRVVSRGQQLSS